MKYVFPGVLFAAAWLIVLWLMLAVGMELWEAIGISAMLVFALGLSVAVFFLAVEKAPESKRAAWPYGDGESDEGQWPGVPS